MSLTSVPPNVAWAIGGIFAVLALATVVTATLGWLRPELALSELRARNRTWWGMAALFSIAMVLSSTVSLVFLGFVSFLALKEYLSLIPTRRVDRRVLLFAYLAVPIQFYWIGIAWYGMFIIFIPVYMFLFLPLPMLIIGETKGFLRAIAFLLALGLPAGRWLDLVLVVLLVLLVLTIMNRVRRALAEAHP